VIFVVVHINSIVDRPSSFEVLNKVGKNCATKLMLILEGSKLYATLRSGN
jgi:hypothetical protein